MLQEKWPKVLDSDFIICQVPLPQDHELNQGTVATAQAGTNLNLFNELRWTNEHQVW